MTKKRRKKKKMRLKVKNFIILVVFICLIFVIGSKIMNNDEKFSDNNKIKSVFSNRKNEEKKKQEKLLNEYNKCLTEKYNEKDNTDVLNDKISKLDSYIYSKYRASVYYEDINTGFSYKYKEEQEYYGASLIKIVEAMYLLDEAEKGNVDLENTKIKYESKYKADFSKGMKTRKIGEEVSLKDLIEYAVTYSDNSAHFMLSNYIGTSNLREYAKGLGATKISVTSGDTFGNQNTVDMNIYLHHAYEIINSKTKYSDFLKKIMLNDDTNALNLTDSDNIIIAHKYGQYDTYYHDVGIAFYDEPYYVSIMTSHGRGKYIEIVNDISKKINELHNIFHEERQKRCHLDVYGS